MTIQFNSDNNLSVSDAFRESLTTMITEDLSRVSRHITRLEIHLSDEDGSKNGQNDKRCLLEARLEGRPPIAVTNLADNHEDALKGALQKLITSLETILGRLRNR